MYGDRAATCANSRREDGVSVEHVRVVAIIGSPIAAQVGDPNHEVPGSKNLCVKTRHGKRWTVERRRRQRRRWRALRVAEGPHADHRLSFFFAGKPGFVESGDCDRERTVGLSGQREVRGVAIAIEGTHPVPGRRNRSGRSPAFRRCPLRHGLRAARHEDVLRHIDAGSNRKHYRLKAAGGRNLVWCIGPNSFRPFGIESFHA
jgi:hypothetical protein